MVTNEVCANVHLPIAFLHSIKFFIHRNQYVYSGGSEDTAVADPRTGEGVGRCLEWWSREFRFELPISIESYVQVGPGNGVLRRWLLRATLPEVIEAGKAF